MLDEDTCCNTTNASWAARVCDTCRSPASSVFCRADSAYLCASCDSRRRERVWMCEACERAPAAFLCKADAASLCTTCDADIHSANPLASRHQRVPIGSLCGGTQPHQTQFGPDCVRLMGCEVEMMENDEDDENDEDEAASWLLLNPLKNNNGNNNNNNLNGNNGQNHQQGNNGFLFGGEVDEYLDLVDCSNSETNSNNNNNNQFGDGDHYGHQNQNQHQYGVVGQKSYGGGDSVVPVQHGQHHFQLGLEFEPSKAGFSYNSSITQSVSVSSMDVGVVPESTISNVSISHSRAPKGTIDLFSGQHIHQMASHLAPMDREARVLRYREKKKTRKFEKTIRYASRKAYAETRPRIKGRFAKRTDVEAEVDQMFSSTLISDVGYGIVPSF